MTKTPKLTLEGLGRICHEANRAYCLVVGDDALEPWDDVDDSYRASTRQGIRKALDGDGPEAQHESWMKERLSQGWTYGPQLDRQARIHPNLVDYHELPVSQQRKDQLFLAIVEVFGEDLEDDDAL